MGLPVKYCFCPLLQHAGKPQSLHSSLLFCLCTAPPVAAEYVCPAIPEVGPAPPPHPLSLARHLLGRPRCSSHPVDLLPIHPCGRCRCSSHPSGKTCFSSQPLALTAGSRQLSLVSQPLGRLDQSSQPSYLICFFPLFSLFS